MRRGKTVQVAVTIDELELWKRSHQQLERTAGMLRSYQLGGIRTVAVEDVLDLLGQDPDGPAEAPGAPPRDPLEDPLTGARWPGPPGTSPPPF